MRAAAGVFLAALGARLAFWRLQGTLPLAGDALEYDAFARGLVETGRYLGPHGEAASRMPGYPLFLAGLRVLFGASPAAVVVSQCLLGALTCVILLDLARRFVPEKWAAACGLIAAFYYDLIVPAAAPLSECLYSFFLVLSVWCLYHPSWKPLRRAVSFAALSACLYLVRPEPLPYIICSILLMPYLWAKFSRKEVLSALAVFTLIVGVWVGRNFAQFGRLMPASSVGKSVGYLSLYLPAEKMGLAGERHAPPEAMTELERDADFAKAYKALAATLTGAQIAKAYAYNLVSILYPFLPQYDWTYVFVAPFWLLGCAVAARRKELWPVAGAVLCSLTVFTFFGGYASRYRQGVSPFIVLLAVAGMKAAYDAAGEKRFRLVSSAWLGANVLIWIFQGQARAAALWLRAASWGH
jgi:4-amino-4-deoxy-L-arabinose transferase-like glycosyltransferase